ncbi:LADA_0F07096g1_1 [Lachancea dasiensis]|uniref:non-specific serine/threonine protein kinase n=1 Tax=Lachancea dasiensis TaxID=1072105 RepID=A0A1G4JKS4_9SACH|nr:LADA_0F07096g1_1 [Lachancea dasiensis]
MPYIGAPHNKDRFDALKEKLCMDRPEKVSQNVSGNVESAALEVRANPSKLASSPPDTPQEAVSPKQEPWGSRSGSELESKELLTFPNESTHAYSYNPLSPNSLAVRLRILKRSLEIMIRNPALLLENHLNHHVRVDTPDGTQKDFNLSTHTDLSPTRRSNLSRSYSQDGLKPLSTTAPRNASSAALSALVTNTNSPSDARKPFTRPVAPFQMSSFSPRPPDSRHPPAVNASSLTLHGGIKRGSLDSAAPPAEEADYTYKSDFHQNIELLKTKRAELESLLVLLNDALENNSTEKASDLHMISLLNFNKLSLDVDKSDSSGQDSGPRMKNYENTLKKNLLESLAQPFYENANAGEGIDEAEEYLCSGMDHFSLENSSFSNMKSSPVSNRLLHTFVSSKNSSPQAIFTCLQQNPWQFKSANDLACLTFGISKNALRALTLLDLIHTDSRNFVLNKILSTEGQELVFTGEIVAIVQPGDSSSQLVWSSIWAKRRNGVIFCVFEKVPCDFIDVLLSLDDFSVDHISGGTGLKGFAKGTGKSDKVALKRDCAAKKSVQFPNEVRDVGDLSHGLKKLITSVESGDMQVKDGDLLPMPIKVSNAINEVRYFTLNHLSFNIPCAISSSILENELKLKIHSLPYQAGIFFIDSKDYKMVSFNKSISKNMFGIHAADLLNKQMTAVIPTFGDLIGYVNLKYPSLDITLPKNKGLVLTEHFFRKIQAEMNNNDNSFFESIGINALHRDGNIIKVDIQLRVISSSHSLLWITHSRDVVFENYKTNPSQLVMLKESEIAVVTSGSSSRGSLKNSHGRLPVDELPNLKDSLKLDGSTVGSFDGTSEPSEENIEDSPETPTDEGNSGRTKKLGVEKVDDEISSNLDVTRNYGQDKSLFLKDSDFKLDERLILSLNSNSNKEPNGSDATSGFMATRVEESRQNFLRKPVPNIGSLKHVRKFSDFVVLQKMGEGAYGKVDLCMHKEEKYIVVIKLIFKERILVDTWVRDRKLGTIPSEIQIMATLNTQPHENILMLLDFFEDDDYYYIETPVHGTAGSIDLFDLIELKTDMTEHEAKLIFKQIVSGIKHLHDNGIVHRDIKDENVIVDTNGFVKIVDFGSAAYVKSGPFDVFVGTIDYAAPEVLGGDPYEGKPQDIWAIGVLLYTIIYKENPFYNIDEILDADLRINPSHRVSNECVELIRKILNRCVAKRPSINEIYRDKWLNVSC